MTIDGYSPDDLEAFITLARKHGVTHLRVGDVEFSLGTIAIAAGVASPKAPLPESLVPRCSCGHPRFDHRGDVGCIHGCPPTRCIPNPPSIPE